MNEGGPSTYPKIKELPVRTISHGQFLSLLFCNRNCFNRIPRRSGILLGVAACNGIDHIQSFGHLPKNGVIAIELRSGQKRDEELTAIGIASSIRHGDNTRFIKGQVAVFILKLIPRTTHAAAGRVTTLSHETFQYSMESDPIKISLTSQKDKAIDGLWRLIGIKLNDEFTAFCQLHIGRILLVRINIQRWLTVLL